MQLSHDTLLILAYSGDEQAIEVLRSVENNTLKSLLQTTIYFQEGPGIFSYVETIRHHQTMLGIPVITEECLVALVASHSNGI